MDFRVRGYRGGDAQGAIDVFEHSVAALGPSKYSDEHVAAWLSGVRDPRQWDARILPREAYVAESSDGRILGWIEMEMDGHLDFLYVAPQASRRGIADALYLVLLAGARKLGITHLHTEASLFAESFFRRHGWHDDGRDTVTRAGVTFSRAKMSFNLPV